MQFIALLSMVVDHIGTLFLMEHEIIQLITGLVGIALPVMASYIVTGCEKTRDIKKYFFRVLVIGLIAHVPWMFLGFDYLFNDVISLAFGILLVIIYKKSKYISFMVYITAVFGILSNYMSFIPYSLVYTIHVLRRGSRPALGEAMSIILHGAMMIISGGIQYITWLIVPILLRYFKGKEINVPRVIKYSVYPLHFYVLVAIKSIGGIIYA